MDSRFFLKGRGVALIGVAWACSLVSAHAAEVRVLDSIGLVRATRVIKDRARISIRLQPGQAGVAVSGRDCTLSNLDGVAKEQRVNSGPDGVCEFRDIPSGAWEVSVASGVRWSVTINE